MTDQSANPPGRADDAPDPNAQDNLAEDAAKGDPSEASGPSGESGGGSRTGSSFDTLLGRVVVARGLVSEDELGQAKTGQDMDPDGSLGAALLRGKFITTSQLDRLKTELDSEQSSQRIPGYRIIRKLGSGAMATVFLAKQLSLDRLVAIKVLPRRFSSNSDFIERFYKEGRAAARLNDPNIVAAYDVGQAGDHHYFVMEYVDGDTVYDRIKDAKRFDEASAIRVTMQVASALRHAHAVGFIHRDIKPKNIMLTKGDSAKLADLGLARALSDKEAAEAEAGRAYGTPFYISPEQIRGRVNIGPEADIYGLGATLYHMVTGRVPFKGKNPTEVMHKHLKDNPTPPDHLNPEISSGLALVIEMMMAKSHSERYRSASELLEDLELVSNGEQPRYARPAVDVASVISTMHEPGETATPPTRIKRSNSGVTGNPVSMTMVALLVISVLLNVILIGYYVSRS
ncbi:MAG: serine/threonine protein kinase [Phycisphaerales bacterium]|nr:serine/threonine protein kinase [Phycisphaerales bacterium]